MYITSYFPSIQSLVLCWLFPLFFSFLLYFLTVFFFCIQGVNWCLFHWESRNGLLLPEDFLFWNFSKNFKKITEFFFLFKLSWVGLRYSEVIICILRISCFIVCYFSKKRNAIVKQILWKYLCFFFVEKLQ